ncbi:MAG: fibronectin type III domain-containing protein, partial [Sphingobacteriales bacterium]
MRLASNATSFTDSGLTAGTQYYYHVFSYNDNCTGEPYYSTSALTASQNTPCATGTSVTASNVTNNKATVSWTGTGNYVVEYGPTGFTPGTAATAGTNGVIASASTSSPITITGLTASTAYQVYVRQICSLGGYSANSSVLAFTTLCPPVTTFPANQDFTTYIPTCWFEAAAGSLSAGPTSVGSSTWAADGYLNVGTTGAAKINIDAATDNDWIVSPYFTIAAGMQLKYNVAALQWNTTTALTTPWEADDFVELVYSTDMVNWTVLKTYNSSNVPSFQGQTDTIDISTLNGQTVHFAFRGVEGTSDGGADIDFMIDNFTVEVAPLTVPACVTNLTPADLSTGVIRNTTITWSAAANALSYDVYFGTNSNPAFVANTTQLAYTPVPLSANTQYFYKVVAKNNVGDATGCQVISFTTGTDLNYCTPAYTGVGSASGNEITNVTVKNLNNTTGASAAPFYTFYNALAVPSLYRGVTENISVSFGVQTSQYVGVWIDFNQNGTFETAEFVGPNTNYGASGVATVSIVVPSGAVLGNTRMRIIGGKNGSAYALTDACSTTLTQGEVEDYIVNIANPPLPTITGFGSPSACANGNITINGTDLSGAVASGVTVNGTAVSSITSN